jgi:hypothetical protein
VSRKASAACIAQKWRRGGQGAVSGDGGSCAVCWKMNAIALTAFVGLVLVTLFILLFLIHMMDDPPLGGQESLLPLADEQPSTRAANRPRVPKPLGPCDQ